MAVAPPVAPPNATYIVKPGDPITLWSWAIILLTSLGIHPNDQNVKAVVGWEIAEGGMTHNGAKWNPLNTTMNAPGATSINSDGVKAYPDFLTGLNATLQTLRLPAYSGILNALRGGSSADVGNAVDNSPWGTKGLLSLLSSGTDLSGRTVLGGPYTGPSLTDKILTGPVGNAVASAIPHIPGASFLEAIGKGSTWVRILYVIGGLILGIIGFMVMIKDTSVGKTAIKAAKVAAVA